MEGKVFGSSGDVRSLARVVKLCMDTISQNNYSAKVMLSAIEGSESDRVYQQAQEIVDYVSKAVELGEEPLETVVIALNQYADLLESHGK